MVMAMLSLLYYFTCDVDYCQRNGYVIITILLYF
jgi:hypothetical protein